MSPKSPLSRLLSSITFSVILVGFGGTRFNYQMAQTAEPTQPATSAPVILQIVIRDPNNKIQVANTKILSDAKYPTFSTGMLPLAGVVAGTIYALDLNSPGHVLAVDSTGTHSLSFVQNPSYGIAVQPATATQKIQLGWATSPTSDGPQSELFASAPDGTQLTHLLTQSTAGTAPIQLVAERWSKDGQSLYFSKEPYGIGGYILFAGASSLYRANLLDKNIKEIIPFNLTSGKMLCIDDLSTDDHLIADHCARTTVTITDLNTNKTSTIQPPKALTSFRLLGSARFSPDLTRVAFALAKGDPSGEQGWVAVSDGLNGASKTIVTGKAGEYYSVIGWLNMNTLLLESNSLQCSTTCVNSLWTVGTDGKALTKIADGSFLAVMPH